MSNLVPEKRMNVNGHLVTKHVRVGGPSAPRRGIPAVMDMFAPKDPAVRAGVETYKASIQSSKLFAGLDKKTQRNMMRTLAHHTLPTLAKHGFGLGDGGKGIPKNVVTRCVRDGNFMLLNNFADYVENYGGFTTPEMGDWGALPYVLSLGGGKASNPLLQSYGFTPYSKADPEEREQQHAVIEATRILEPQHLLFEDDFDGLIPFKWIANNDLVDYFMIHPDTAAKTAHLINKRGIEPHRYDFTELERLSEAGDEIPDALLDGSL